MTLNDHEWLEWPFYVKFSLLRTDLDGVIYLFIVESVYIHVTYFASHIIIPISPLVTHFMTRGSRIGS